jgi:hypothetical protein
MMKDFKSRFADQRGVTIVYDARVTLLPGLIALSVPTLHQAGHDRAPFALSVIMASMALLAGAWLWWRRDGQCQLRDRVDPGRTDVEKN